MSMEIALALGGGGIKGISHLGVLRFLNKEGIKIKAISGTSAGGAFGSLYAAGYDPEEIIAYIKSVDQSKLFGRQHGDAPSLLGLSGVSQVLNHFLGDRTFEDLQYPFSVVAVDINTAREVFLHQGRVMDALLATMAIPGVFPPKSLEDMMLVDGGVLNPVPVIPVRTLAPGVPVIAVVLSDPLKHGITPNSPLAWIEQTPFLQPLTRLRVAQAYTIFMQSIDIYGYALTDLRLKVDAPEIIIRPDMRGIGVLDRVDIDDLVLRGNLAAQQKKADIKRTFSFWGRLGGRLGLG